MIRRFFATDDSLAGTVLRIALGGVLFPHGAMKLLGWFGGCGYAATALCFVNRQHIPELLAIAVILAESIGAAALVAGFFTRLAALALAVDMTMAIILVHWKIGFFMNWSGKAAGEGFEYHLLMIAIGLALVIKGGGRWSIDGAIAKRLKGKR